MRGFLVDFGIVAIVGLALGTTSPLHATSAVASPLTSSTAGQPGTTSWHLAKPADGQIEGFSSAASGTPGQPIRLSVSTIDPSFVVQAFRFGDYTGGPAHLVWSSTELPGVHQPSAQFDPYETRTVVAPWTPSVRIDTDGWEPGAYLLKLTSSSGYDTHIPYIVRSVTTAGTVALVAPVATWQAYNKWGGYSLYVGANEDRRSWVVSFDRPYSAPGRADFVYGVKPVVVLAERLGIPLSYLANTDLASDPGVLQGARAYVSMGHDEYWTPQMRQVVTAARDAGTNVMFLGANTMYWRIRLDANDLGQPTRRVIGYRMDAKLDPALATDPELVTARWRDPPAPNPENSLIGMLYECFPVNADYRVASPRWWGFRGTDVSLGTSFPQLVGVEADRVYPIASTPRPLQVLSYKSYPCRGVQTSTESTYYTTPSGAGVFAAGTLRWTCAIDGPCGSANLSGATNAFVRQVTRRVLRVFSQGPAGFAHPAKDNVARFPLPAENQVPAS